MVFPTSSKQTRQARVLQRHLQLLPTNRPARPAAYVHVVSRFVGHVLLFCSLFWLEVPCSLPGRTHKPPRAATPHPPPRWTVLPELAHDFVVLALDVHESHVLKQDPRHEHADEGRQGRQGHEPAAEVRRDAEDG